MTHLRIALLALLCAPAAAFATDYYVSPTGSDANNGLTPQTAWRTFNNFNSAEIGSATPPFLQAGDRILIPAGVTLTVTNGLKLWKSHAGPDWILGNADDTELGNILANGGTPAQPIVVTTHPANGAPATVQVSSVDSAAIDAYNVQGFEVRNLNLVGPGNQASTRRGIDIYCDANFAPSSTIVARHIVITDVTATQFRTGAFIGAGDPRVLDEVLVEDCVFHANADGGLSTWSTVGKKLITDLVFRRIVAHGNVGRAGLENPSGSGIVLGGVTRGLVEHCIAYDNGVNNTHFAGPVGIWMYECADSVIQFSESYANKTNGGDGGGFDIDGGCTNSVIQYCYSHDNQGPGYLFAQYKNASAFSGNVMRYNVSQNDNRKGAYGSLHVWGDPSNGSNSAKNSAIYGNTVYSDTPPAGTGRGFMAVSNYTGIKVFNNLFYLAGPTQLVSVSKGTAGVQLRNNLYYSTSGTYQFIQQGATYASLAAWRAAGNEMASGSPVGVQADPLLHHPGAAGTVGDTTRLAALVQYRLRPGSPAENAGVAPSAFGYTDTTRDYHGAAAPLGSVRDIGAAELAANLVANPGFESGATSWQNWGQSYVQTAAKFYGTNGLRSGSTTTAGGRGNVITGLTPGQRYLFGAWAQHTASGTPGYLGITFGHADGTETQTVFTTTSTAWQAYGGVVTAPATFTSAYVWAWKDAGAAYQRADDFILTPLAP